MLREKEILERMRGIVTDYWRDIPIIVSGSLLDDIDLLLEEKEEYPLYGDNYDAISMLDRICHIDNLWGKYIKKDHDRDTWCINVTSDAIEDFEQAIIGHENDPYYDIWERLIKDMKELKKDE